MTTNKTRQQPIRIDAAIAFAKENGIRVKKKDLALMMWPDANEATRTVNMVNLSSGRRKSILPEWVRIICRECGCSADFLFGIEKK